MAQQVAAGDLTGQVQPEGRDEMAQLLEALRTMSEALVRIVGGVRGSSDAISSASSQIAAGNLDLSQRTEEQAASLEQTAASLEQIGATVRQNYEGSQHANQVAAAAADVALRGGTVVSQVVHTMEAINASSRKIADIIGVIDGIAFQTNILALNAAVEAARAGEQGGALPWWPRKCAAWQAGRQRRRGRSGADRSLGGQRGTGLSAGGAGRQHHG